MVKKLFVGNLSWDTTDDDLRNEFSRVAPVVSASIATDRDTGRSRGFGFVEVNDSDMEAVISGMNGKNVGGRDLTVNEARPREERGFGGGSGGGGGFRGGRGGSGGGGGGGRRW